MTHDYKRHCTTTLFTALNALADTPIGRYMLQHRHEVFIPFLNDVGWAVAAANRSKPSPTTMPLSTQLLRLCLNFKAPPPTSIPR